MWCVWLLQHWSQQMAQPAASNLTGTVAHCTGPPEPLDSTEFWRQELQQEEAQCFCGSLLSQATCHYIAEFPNTTELQSAWHGCCKQLSLVIYLWKTWCWWYIHSFGQWRCFWNAQKIVGDVCIVLLSDQLAFGSLCQQLASNLVTTTALMVWWLVNIGIAA